MTHKKDRRSARTKKREEKDYLASLTRKDFTFISYASECRPLSKSIVTGIDSCESGCDKTVIVNWTPPVSQQCGIVIMGCDPDSPEATCYFGDCKPWFDMKWFKMPSWPRSHSSCAAMSPEPCQ